MSIQGIGVGLFLVIVVGVMMVLAIYLLPTWIAVARRKRQKLAIFAVNILFGWTFVFWALTLIWACWNDEDSAYQQSHEPHLPYW